MELTWEATERTLVSAGFLNSAHTLIEKACEASNISFAEAIEMIENVHDEEKRETNS